jgi:SAM-dependent methyltransferase
VILDSGCGYSWTTEWLAKSGFEVIGVDICRAYLEVGIRRIGESHPHLVVADVENLPIAGACADAVLAYESFHHIPDRVKAMAGYARILKDGASVVLAEPGEDHETAAVSVDVMSRYGILERGMELEDVEGYIAGSPFGPPEQLWVMHASAAELERGINLPSAWRHSVFPGNVFRVRKDASRIASAPPSSRSTSPSAPNDPAAPPSASPDEDLRALHNRMTHEWSTEVRRLSAELRRTSGELAALKRSPFWRARRVCLRLMALFGSARAGIALKSGT